MVAVGPTESALRNAKLAAVFDEQVAPLWTLPMAQGLLEGLELPAKAQALDAACRGGHLTADLARMLPDDGRIMAIDRSGELIALARRRLNEMGLAKKSVYFRTESELERMPFAEQFFDVVVCNAEVLTWAEPQRALAEFARIAKRGGQVRFSLPLAGTYSEFLDLFADALVAQDRPTECAALALHRTNWPSAGDVLAWCKDAGMRATCTVYEQHWLFRSAEEFFVSPLIEFGPLAQWRALAGDGAAAQNIMRAVRDAISEYYVERPFEVTIRPGVFIATVA